MSLTFDTSQSSMEQKIGKALRQLARAILSSALVSGANPYGVGVGTKRLGLSSKNWKRLNGPVIVRESSFRLDVYRSRVRAILKLDICARTRAPLAQEFGEMMIRSTQIRIRKGEDG